MKEVSLYIPCYNAAETISYCLKGVFKQTYPLKEVVVVDDASKDETAKIASRYPVRMIKHISNQGLAVSRNTAIKNIDTEFIAALDSDCIPEPNWLEILMKRFNSPKIVGAGGKLLEYHASTIFDLWRSVHMKQYWEDGKADYPFLFGSNTVFRRKALVNIKFYNEKFKNNYEDVDICNRLQKSGYKLFYESKAIASHLRKDDICSLLDSYWNWNLGFYQKNRYYSSQKNFVFKLKDNLGLANRYLEEDISSKRYQLLYLDFLLGLHHSLKHFAYFISQDNGNISEYPLLSLWLSLLDLTFFYHFDSTKNNLSTLLNNKNTFIQTTLALNLILGRPIQEKFRSRNFQKILSKHLLLSLFRINDSYLIEKLVNLVELHPDWGGLFNKRHPHLNTAALKNLFIAFQEWMGILTYRFRNIVQIIKTSAEETDKLVCS